MCRLCLERDIQSNLIKPCRCKGSKSFTHRSCLVDHLKENNTRRCRGCTVNFKVKVSKLKLSNWVIEPELYSERLTILTTFSVHFYTMVILLGCSLTLLTQYTKKAHSDERLSFINISKLVTGIGLLIGFFVFLFYQTPYYYKIFNTLRCYNNPVHDVFAYNHDSPAKDNNSEKSFVNLINKFSSANKVSTFQHDPESA